MAAPAIAGPVLADLVAVETQLVLDSPRPEAEDTLLEVASSADETHTGFLVLGLDLAGHDLTASFADGQGRLAK